MVPTPCNHPWSHCRQEVRLVSTPAGTGVQVYPFFFYLIVTLLNSSYRSLAQRLTSEPINDLGRVRYAMGEFTLRVWTRLIEKYNCLPYLKVCIWNRHSTRQRSLCRACRAYIEESYQSPSRPGRIPGWYLPFLYVSCIWSSGCLIRRDSEISSFLVPGTGIPSGG